MIGISHQAAPVAVRERYAFTPAELPSLLARLGARYAGVAVVSTCNRTEVYIADAASVADAQPVIETLNGAKHIAPLEAAPFFTLHDAEAVRHLFRVASGIESMVVGESEILGQVREAFTAATAAGTHAPALSRLFHDAIRTGRRVRAQTSIGHYPVSVSSTAVALARQVLGDLSRMTVLVVGAGEAGQLTASNLAGSGIDRMLVTSRNAERTSMLAAALDARAIPFENRGRAMANADIVISSTAATEFVIDAPMVAAAMARRSTRPLILIDIAVPRDIDPAAGEVPGVHLYDIDHVQAVADDNLQLRRQEIGPAEDIVDAGVRRYVDWLRQQDVAPTIATLRANAEATRIAELQRTLARTTMTDEDRARVEAMTAALVNKLLHAPVELLRDPAEGDRYVHAARALFGLDRAEPDPGSDSEPA
jgi:glutamyl-tRNA reductase